MQKRHNNFNFERGDVVKDTLGNYIAIVRSIEKDWIKLSRLDRLDLFYLQVERYIKAQ